MPSHIKLAIGTVALGLTSSQLSAEPTKVAVRVISADAKFIGDSMGGAVVTLRDARTGRLLVRLGANGIHRSSRPFRWHNPDASKRPIPDRIVRAKP